MGSKAAHVGTLKTKKPHRCRDMVNVWIKCNVINKRYFDPKYWASVKSRNPTALSMPPCQDNDQTWPRNMYTLLHPRSALLRVQCAPEDKQGVEDVKQYCEYCDCIHRGIETKSPLCLQIEFEKRKMPLLREVTYDDIVGEWEYCPGQLNKMSWHGLDSVWQDELSDEFMFGYPDVVRCRRQDPAAGVLNHRIIPLANEDKQEDVEREPEHEKTVCKKRQQAIKKRAQGQFITAEEMQDNINVVRRKRAARPDDEPSEDVDQIPSDDSKDGDFSSKRKGKKSAWSTKLKKTQMKPKRPARRTLAKRGRAKLDEASGEEDDLYTTPVPPKKKRGRPPGSGRK